MAVYFLYYFDQYPGLPVTRTFADQVIGAMFGYNQVIIDPSGEQHASPDHLPLVMRSLEEAREHPWLKGLHWVYLHPRAEKTLQDYEHPEDDVIYCIGSDWNGLGVDLEDDKNADFLRIAAPDHNEENRTREFHATVIIPIVVYDRALKLWQHRHSHTT